MTAIGLLLASLVILTGVALAVNPSWGGTGLAVAGGTAAAAACVISIRLFRRSTDAANARGRPPNP